VFDIGHFGAPGPVFGTTDQARLDGVHADVLECAVPVVLVPDHPRGEALAEEGADAIVDSVVLAGVRAVRTVERRGEVLGAA
jgi:hypothetical protein